MLWKQPVFIAENEVYVFGELGVELLEVGGEAGWEG